MPRSSPHAISGGNAIPNPVGDPHSNTDHRNGIAPATAAATAAVPHPRVKRRAHSIKNNVPSTPANACDAFHPAASPSHPDSAMYTAENGR